VTRGPYSPPPPPAAPPATSRIAPELVALADAHGVATSYLDAHDREITVEADVVRAVLALLDVDVEDPAAALAAAADAPWRRALPAAAVVRRSAPGVINAHVAAGTAVRAEIVFAGGGRADVAAGEARERRHVDGVELVKVPLVPPDGMPLGDHVLTVRAGGTTSSCQLVAVPDRMPDPPAAGPAADLAADLAAGPASAAPERTWGWMIQLYAVRSAGSWGMGDYRDLADIAAWAGGPSVGADVLLINPVHATAPTRPVADSPYYPTSRRFVSPLYLRPQELPEYAAAGAETRAAVDALAATVPNDGPIDRDAVWTAKLAALELLFAHARPDGAAAPETTSAGAVEFATWCALAELHGPDWRAWPEDLRHPAGPAVAAAREGLADRVAFHLWLQRRCDDALAAAQAAARAAGMAVGVVHDLAVGVDPGGADAWADADAYATGARVGAPPDEFNQRGQDWGFSPWRPDRLAESGYAPLRRMAAAVLARGGGLRVDHILGLFRLWWIPAGNPASAGTYVRYDAAAMLGVLALEATRAGGLVVGEDLGTLEAATTKALADAGVLGSAVLWFERDDDGEPLPPARWRSAVVASATTHDLPTVAGWLTGEHVRVRARLGQLGRPEADERAAWRAERSALISLLAAEDLLPTDLPAAEAAALADPDSLADIPPPATVRELAFALHALIARSPARIVLAAPTDALGERAQPNLPGTVDEYPNWRLPAADGDGVPLTVERLRADPAPRRLAAILARGG